MMYPKYFAAQAQMYSCRKPISVGSTQSLQARCRGIYLFIRCPIFASENCRNEGLNGLKHGQKSSLLVPTPLMIATHGHHNSHERIENVIHP